MRRPDFFRAAALLLAAVFVWIFAEWVKNGELLRNIWFYAGWASAIIVGVFAYRTSRKNGRSGLLPSVLLMETGALLALLIVTGIIFAAVASMP